jgi:hypothetical protein
MASQPRSESEQHFVTMISDCVLFQTHDTHNYAIKLLIYGISIMAIISYSVSQNECHGSAVSSPGSRKIFEGAKCV